MYFSINFHRQILKNINSFLNILFESKDYHLLPKFDDLLKISRIGNGKINEAYDDLCGLEATSSGFYCAFHSARPPDLEL